MNHSPFFKLILGSLGGVTLGIIFGFFFSFLIAWISSQFGTQGVEPMQFGPATFLGMGFGAIIGAIMGGAVASRK